MESSPVASAPPKLAPLAFAKPLRWSTRPTVSAHLDNYINHPLPLKLEPQQMSNPSKLCATTPAFVPGSQQPRTSTTLGAGGNDDEIRDRTQNILSEPSTSQCQQMDEQHKNSDTLPLSGHSSYSGFPNYLEERPVASPRFYYRRANASRKDIVITEKGAIRNAIEIVERFLPNGSRYHDYRPIFEASDYDFVAEFKAMSTHDQAELLKDKEVEVVVMLKTNDDEDKIESKKKKKKNKSKKYKPMDKEGKASMAAADNNSGDMEKEVQGAADGGDHSGTYLTEQNPKSFTKEDLALGLKDDDAEVNDVNNFGTANAKVTSVIDTINALGPDFAKHTTSLWVTIDFTSISPPLGFVPAIPTGPRAMAEVNPQQPIKFGSNFAFVIELVAALQVFTELKQMRINLRVRESPTGFPFTLQQLVLVLPFYDLEFPDWSVSYQGEVFTATVPIRDNEFPMKWLDRKRYKVLRARERHELLRQRKLNVNSSPAVFIEQSRTHGKFSLLDFVKESRK